VGNIRHDLPEYRAGYRAAALQLAEAAGVLAEAILETSDDMIDCRFAVVRAAYAKCKGAHGALMTESVTEVALSSSECLPMGTGR